MAKQECLHLAYLIRLWQVQCEGQLVWRASLEDAHSGEKRGFGDPAGLFAFLQEKLGLEPDEPENNDPSYPAKPKTQNDSQREMEFLL